MRSLLLLLALAISTSLAVPSHIALNFQKPNVLSEYLTRQSENDHLRLISLSESYSRWMTAAEIQRLVINGKNFMDITEWDFSAASRFPKAEYDFPDNSTLPDLVLPLLQRISIPIMTETLAAFTHFQTRYYNSVSGKKSGDWLFSVINSYLKKLSNSKMIFHSEQVEQGFKQRTIIVRLVPIDKAAQANPIIILSAHQDSINGYLPWFGRAPGADDNGSGTVSILEVLRILCESLSSHDFNEYFQLDRGIEFHWYTAEEGGLLGSQKVVLDYARRGEKVRGVLHFDMVSFFSYFFSS